MSHLLRCGLVAAGLVTAFAAGFYLKPVPRIQTVAAQPPAQPVMPPPLIDPDVNPATALGQPQPARPEPPDPLDAAGMAMIGKEMGLPKTTVIDKSEPLPAVLADAQKTTPPSGAKGESYIEFAPPTPMDGPIPRLEPPPMPAMPTIPDVVPPPTAPPAAVKLVNTRAIALDFKVTKTGSSPVTATELWTTRDGGNTWAKTDRKAGCQSPFRTQLGSEGLYGFRLVFESESGMRSAEPKRGDKPDLSAELDTTPPVITLFAPGPVLGASGNVRIGWHMSDAHPDPWNARVEYSADGRTWHLVSDKPEPGSPGHYHCDWTPPPGLPPRVMLRVTGRDGAGNSATVATADRVSIDLVTPAGKVMGVRSDQVEVGPMPREADAPVGVRGAIPDPLRSVLPILLGSPSVLPALTMRPAPAPPSAGQVTGDEVPDFPRTGVIGGWQETLPQEPPLSAREWVKGLTNTTVVEEEALPPYRRPDPFAVPQLSPELTPKPVVSCGPQIWISWTPEREQFEFYNRVLVPVWYDPSGEQRRLCRETVSYSSGRSLIHHLAVPDWKPTTATPESCRWEYEPAPTDFWGTPPLGLLIQF